VLLIKPVLVNRN